MGLIKTVRKVDPSKDAIHLTIRLEENCENCTLGLLKTSVPSPTEPYRILLISEKDYQNLRNREEELKGLRESGNFPAYTDRTFE